MKKFLLPTAMVAVLLSMLLVAGCSDSSDSYNPAIDGWDRITYPTPSAPTITVGPSEWTNAVAVKLTPGSNWNECKIHEIRIYDDKTIVGCLNTIVGNLEGKREADLFQDKSRKVNYKIEVRYFPRAVGMTSTATFTCDEYNFTYTPLTAPTGVTATKVSDTKVRISWTSTKAMGYNIIISPTMDSYKKREIETCCKDESACEIDMSYKPWPSDTDIYTDYTDNGSCYFWVQAHDMGGKATSDPVHYTGS